MKLYIYTDASFKENYCGWSYLYFIDSNYHQIKQFFGRCSASGSANAEVIACHKALNNVDFAKLQFDSLEIRSDSRELIDTMQKKWLKTTQAKKRFLNSDYFISNRQLFGDIFRIINDLSVSVTFKKMKRKDARIKIAHSNARKANDTLCTEDTAVYMKMPDHTLQVIAGSSQNIVDNEYPNAYFESTLSAVIEVPINSIILTEEIHKNIKSINLMGEYQGIRNKEKVDRAIAVKPIGDDKYSLLAGLNRLAIAKLLNFTHIPVRVFDISYQEFVVTYKNFFGQV